MPVATASDVRSVLDTPYVMVETEHLVIVATPRPLPVIIDRRRFPVHVTVAGTFVVQGSGESAIISLLATSAQGVPSFSVNLGPSAHFGPNSDIPVLLASHGSFDRIHEALASELPRLPGFVAAEPGYWRDGFRPHVTISPSIRIREPAHLTVRVLSLVSLRRATATRIATIWLSAI
jgi:hypothetical protein